MTLRAVPGDPGAFVDENGVVIRIRDMREATSEDMAEMHAFSLHGYEQACGADIPGAPRCMRPRDHDDDCKAWLHVNEGGSA